MAKLQLFSNICKLLNKIIQKNNFIQHFDWTKKNEWTKVKGRFQEIPFNEPPEILLNLVSKQLQAENKITIGKNAENLYQLALQTKTVSEGFEK